MKPLYLTDKWSLGIYDDDNYVVFDINTKRMDKKTNKEYYFYRYFSTMEGAVREIARLMANDGSSYLEHWLYLYSRTKGTMRYLTKEEK